MVTGIITGVLARKTFWLVSDGMQVQITHQSLPAETLRQTDIVRTGLDLTVAMLTHLSCTSLSGSTDMLELLL